MSLTVATSVARQALVAAQEELALSGRNIAAAADPERSRVSAERTITIDGGVVITATRRAEDVAVYTRMIGATAALSERDATLSHLTAMAGTVGDPQNGVSVAAKLSELNDALTGFANAPDDPLIGREVVERARELAATLERTTDTLVRERERADREMARGVEVVRDLLSEFSQVNTEVVRGTTQGRDITAALDRRDAIVSALNEEMGVTTILRADGDMALNLDSGVTLYDRGVRRIEFVPTAIFSATTAPGAVFVDGVRVTGAGAPMPLEGGAIAGHAQARDTLLPVYKNQLDEMATALEAIFADGPGSLFVIGDPADPAGTLSVGAGVDPSQGGDVFALRDGTGNPGGSSAFSTRLFGLIDAVEAPRAFAVDAELAQPTDIMDFASQSISWLEGRRASVEEDVQRERALFETASDALSRATGVNLDDEFALQLQIERNFAAASRLIGIIDEVFESLLRIA